MTSKFIIQQEEIVYKRFLTVWNRQVRYPDGKVIEWDVAGHNTPHPSYAVVFPFNTKTKAVSAVLLEYAQGVNKELYTLVAGGFDPKKHKNILETAQHELSEEARLTGGEWIPLHPMDSQGISELKWGRNTFIPFLVLDPIVDPTPMPQDAEEHIQIHSNVSIDALKEYILQGKMMLPSVQTSLMAIEWLKANKYLINPFL